MRKRILLIAALFPGLLLADAKLDPQPELPAVARDDAADTFRPAPFSEIPEGEFGDKVSAGYTIFVNSQTLRDEFVFDDQNCVNCHLNAGRNAHSAPLWAAYFAYPAFRKKNNKINSFSDRIAGCFRYSMNGKVPPEGDDALIAVSAYAYWLGMSGLMNQYGVDGPVPELTDEQLLIGGKVDDFPFPAEVAAGLAGQDVSKLPGRGYPKLAAPELDYDIDRGAEVYDRHCAVCHGSGGKGRRADGISSLPPLWGEGSFNHGAGMHRVNTAAFFIYENMPLGKSIQLTIQEAWDVAAYVTSHERPQDPRFEGDLAVTDKEHHHHACYYGDEIDGATLGSQAYPNPE